MTNCGKSGKAALDDIEAVFAVMVLHVGMTHTILGENVPELEEAFSWVLEAGLRVRARIHLVYKLDSLDLCLCPWIRPDAFSEKGQHTPKSITFP